MLGALLLLGKGGGALGSVQQLSSFPVIVLGSFFSAEVRMNNVDFEFGWGCLLGFIYVQ